MEKKCEISKMFFSRKLDVCALNETKLKGKGEVMFGAGVGNFCHGGREGEGGGGAVTEYVVAEVCSGMEGCVIHTDVG